MVFLKNTNIKYDFLFYIKNIKSSFLLSPHKVPRQGRDWSSCYVSIRRREEVVGAESCPASVGRDWSWWSPLGTCEVDGDTHHGRDDVEIVRGDVRGRRKEGTGHRRVWVYMGRTHTLRRVVSSDTDTRSVDFDPAPFTTLLTHVSDFLLCHLFQCRRPPADYRRR